MTNAATKPALHARRTIPSRGVLLLLGTFGFVSFLYAERPFVTEDAFTSDKGRVQFEFSWDRITWNRTFQETLYRWNTTLGIVEAVDLSLEIPYLIHDLGPDHRHHGPGGIVAGVKWSFLDESGSVPALGIKGLVKTNTG
jgi:hypothetical protein